VEGEGAAQRAYVSDAGVTLPTGLRLLVDGPSVTVTGTAFDPEGKTRQQRKTVTGLRAGGLSQLTLDLSEALWCPAAPPAADESVVFDDAFAPGWSAWGLLQGDAGTPSCTGAAALRFKVLLGTSESVGFQVLPTQRVFPRRVSFRLYSTVAQRAQLYGKTTTGENGPDYVLPTPTICSNDGPGSCDITVFTGWQRVSVEVPDIAKDLALFELAFKNPIEPDGGFEVLLDDIRLTRP
jgi:hypothetical protein